jgi:hypothetical protein
MKYERILALFQGFEPFSHKKLKFYMKNIPTKVGTKDFLKGRGIMFIFNFW